MICGLLGYKLYHTGKLDQTELETAKTELASFNTQYAASFNAKEIFADMPKIGSPVGKMDVSFANLIREINVSGLDAGVRVASYSVMGGAGDTVISQSATPIPFGTGAVSQAPVTIRISYTDYDGMKYFLSHLPEKNIQVTKLDITGTQAVISGQFLATLN